MPRILAIFRKDARRLWPQIGIWLAMLLIHLWRDRVLAFQRFQGEFTMLVQVAMIWLSVSLVHQERLAGDRQYWLARPFGRGELFASKALFLAVFVVVPVFVVQCIELAMLGFSPLSYMPALAWREIVLLWLLLMAVALAVVTRNLAQLILVVLAAIVISTGLQELRIHHPDVPEWLLRIASPVLSGVAYGGAIYLGYSVRRVQAARVVAGCTIAFGILGGLAKPVESELREISARTGATTRSLTGITEVSVTFEGLPAGALIATEGTPIRDYAGNRATLIFAGRVPAETNLDFMAYQRQSEYTLEPGAAIRIPDIGLCEYTLADSFVVCLSPAPSALLAMEGPGGLDHWIVPALRRNLLASGGDTVFRPISHYTGYGNDLRSPRGIKLFTARVLLRGRVHLDLRGAAQ